MASQILRRYASNRTAHWILGGVIGLALGSLAFLSAEITIVLTVAGLLTAAYFYFRVDSEILVGLYWLVFSVKSTVFSEVSVSGLYFPFYGLFALLILSAMASEGVRVNLQVLWPLIALLVLILASFLGLERSVDALVIQRLWAVVVCPLIILQFRSRRGLFVVAALAIMSAMSIAVWVIVNASQHGFAYRGDIEANQNVAAFTIGLGLVIAAGALLGLRRDQARNGLGLALVLSSGLIAYSLLLLASRGMILALAFTLVGWAAQLVVRDWRKIGLILLLAATFAIGLLLPGGAGLLDRFQNETVASAGDRTPIWEATIRAYTNGNVLELLLGHGFMASEPVVERATGVHTSTHNAYLAMLYDYGALGLILFLVLHLIGIIRGWQIGGSLGMVCTGLTLFMLGASLTATETADFLYWIALAYVLAICVWGGSVMPAKATRLYGAPARSPRAWWRTRPS